MGRTDHTQRTDMATMRCHGGAGRSGAIPMPAIRLLLVDHHELVRDALVVRLERESDLIVADAVGTAGDALSTYCAERHDLVVTEHLLPDMTGLALVGTLRERHPGLRAVLLTSADDHRLVVEAVRSGIDGIVRKRWATGVLVGAVRAVADGACVLDRTALDELGAWLPDLQVHPGDEVGQDSGRLSPREVEVLSCLAEGLTNAQIGARLYVSRETVKTHVANLLRKLAVDDRSAAATKAARLGILG